MPAEENGKFGFLAKLNPVAQIILSMGIAVGIITVGVISAYIYWIQPQLEKLHQQDVKTKAYLQKDQIQSEELREAILEDPNLKKTAPKFYDTVKKHTIEDEKAFVRGNSQHTPYYLDIDNLMSAGYTEIKDENSRYIKIVYIEDVFFVYPDNPFSKPENKLEISFAEDYINTNFEEKHFKNNKIYQPLLKYIPEKKAINRKIWDHYRHIKESEKANEKNNSN